MTPASTPPAEAPDRDVTERLARHAESRDPRALWPGLTERALADARGAIEGAVRAVLAGETSTTLKVNGDSAAYAVKIAAYTTGTGPLLGRWIADGRVSAPDAVRTLLTEQLERGRHRAARIEREVLPAIDALLMCGITPVMLKGFHTARAFCEEPGVRPGADVDLLVSPREIDTAEQALLAAGFRPGIRQQRPYKCHWIGAHVDPRTFSIEGVDERNRWEIDLHDSFHRQVGVSWARLSAEQVDLAPFVLAGRPLLAPAPALLVLVLACQITGDLKPMRLMRLIDLVRVIRAHRVNGLLDWNDLVHRLTRDNATRFAYPAFALAENLAPGTIEPGVLAHTRDACNGAIRDSVDRLTPGNTMDKTSVMGHFMWASGPRDVLTYFVGRLSGPETLMATSRLMLRRLAGGYFSFTQSDERDSGGAGRR